MSKCHKCGKPVYFAERKTSLGKDWHRQCLQCEECGRVLNPGQHAEHRGLPYCHIPCYSALFGPVMYGHGSQIEAHNNFGSPQTRRRMPPPNRPDLESKLQLYNSYHDKKGVQLTSKEVNGRLVLEGLLRVYWGVKRQIQLTPRDNVPPQQSHWRHSSALAMDNGFQRSADTDNNQHRPKTENHKFGDILDLEKPVKRKEVAEPQSPNRSAARRSQTVTYRRNKPDRKIRKRYSINGHFYNQETCVFTPVYGTVTNVRVTSLIPVPEVIRLLLAKFKVLNRPEEFCLCVVHKSGETKILADEESPMLRRVLLGPLEDDSKIFIMDRVNANDITHEVAQYAGLPKAVLLGFLKKINDDEEVDVKKIRIKHERYRTHIQLLMENLVLSSKKSSVQL